MLLSVRGTESRRTGQKQDHSRTGIRISDRRVRGAVFVFAGGSVTTGVFSPEGLGSCVVVAGASVHGSRLVRSMLGCLVCIGGFVSCSVWVCRRRGLYTGVFSPVVQSGVWVCRGFVELGFVLLEEAFWLHWSL
ncbi:hypothetical protein WMY93_032976 [Mugilogobius chulae]|uniref:Uncharacterized protein n=1 Tax=Mugilogobius chulae TaxID=88201 RepID=A0AAW0MPA3_9GOBI